VERVAEGDQRAVHGQACRVEIDIAAPQAEQLTEAQTVGERGVASVECSTTTPVLGPCLV
jgi:hypothetical protein